MDPLPVRLEKHLSWPGASCVLMLCQFFFAPVMAYSAVRTTPMEFRVLLPAMLASGMIMFATALGFATVWSWRRALAGRREAKATQRERPDWTLALGPYMFVAILATALSVGSTSWTFVMSPFGGAREFLEGAVFAAVISGIALAYTARDWRRIKSLLAAEQ